jgi:hypothetical protein
MLTDEFISLDEPTEVLNVATTTGFPLDGPKDIGSERRIEPKDPTRKLSQSSDPSPDLGLQRPKLGWVGVVENLRSVDL